MKNFYLLIALFSLYFSKAQTYIMNNTNVAIGCPSSSLFYDSGNVGGNYANNENFTKTFTAPAGQCLSITLANIDIESCCDDLNIYDGPTTASPLLANLFGTIAGPVTYVSSGNTMTFRFTSDGSVIGAGWQATITCAPPCILAPTPGVISISSSTVGCASGGPVTLSAAGSSAGCGILSQWQSAPSATGPWTNISNATGAASANVSYIGQTFFRKRACCGALCAFSNTISVGSGTAPATCDLSTYVPSVVPYSFDVFAGTLAPSTDDVLYSSSILFGFPFCFTGAQYGGGFPASNGALVFSGVPCFPNVYFNQMAAGGIGTGYVIDQPAPSKVNNSTSTPQNAVLGPWHDIDPSVGGTIRYTTLGVAPNRRFVISFLNVPMYSSPCNTNASKDFTGQIKLFETSNNIEIHITNKQICATWNNGAAILGLTSFDGNTYVPPVNATAHNYPTQWTMTNTAYRFTSPCAAPGGPCAVLPVNFKSFYGERLEGINKLTWESAVESGVKNYIVERASDAENFVEIAKITPNNLPSKYTFDDKTTMPGTLNYYRITSFENNGQKTRTNVLPLGAKDGEIAVSGIYPNPVKGDFAMIVDSKIVSILTINLYDTFGKLVKTINQNIGTGVTPLNLNCSDLNAGIYLLESIDSNKKVVSKQKMIKVD